MVGKDGTERRVYSVETPASGGKRVCRPGHATHRGAVSQSGVTPDLLPSILPQAYKRSI